MQRTVDLLEKYEMKLPNETQEMFRSAPDRWNHLKTKVSLAKQRLGPRIQVCVKVDRFFHQLFCNFSPSPAIYHNSKKSLLNSV